MILKTKQMNLCSLCSLKILFLLSYSIFIYFYKLYKSPSFHFQTLTIPSLEAVTMKPCVVWNVATSVMMSWWPTGRDSGPFRGASSLGPTFCLFWISCLVVKSQGESQKLKAVAHSTACPSSCFWGILFLFRLALPWRSRTFTKTLSRESSKWCSRFPVTGLHK